MCFFHSFLFFQRLNAQYGINLLIFGAMREFGGGDVKEERWQVYIYDDSCVCFAQNKSSSHARLSAVSTFFPFVLTDSLYVSALLVQFSIQDVSHVLVLSGSFCCRCFLIP